MKEILIFLEEISPRTYGTKPTTFSFIGGICKEYKQGDYKINMTKNDTNREIALFMLQLYNEEKFLLQKVAALEILEKFGDTSVLFNRNRNLGIDKNVLNEFKKLTLTSIWDRRLKAWREKENDDPNNSRQTIYK